MNQLQLFAWHAEGRILFIASGGGTFDLVKEQTISEVGLQSIRRRYEQLAQQIVRARSSVGVAPHVEVGSSLHDLGNLVHRLVLHPDLRNVLAAGGYSELIISTNEFAIPWELLATDASFIALEHPVTRRLQTARPLASPSRLSYRAKIRVLLVYNPTGDLADADREAQSIQQLLTRYSERFVLTTLTRENCTRFEVLPRLLKADVFHFAGHASFDPGRPKDSCLLLNDGPLLASEIENYLEGAAPSLVFLNACESAAFGSAERVITGEDMSSLAHPFIACGSSAVIAASLPIGDVQAAFFANSVYENLVEGRSITESAWIARRAAAERFGLADPTWSSFLIFGEGEMRFILSVSSEQIRPEEIRSAMHGAGTWLLEERIVNGVWCDRVYRTEAQMNAAEAILGLYAAGIAIPDEVLARSLELFLAESVVYTAAPYEPAFAGTFVSCVAISIRAMLACRSEPRLEEYAAHLDERIREATELLVSLRLPSGGWSWGADAEAGEYTLFTIEALEALAAADGHVDCELEEVIRAGLSSLIQAQRADGGWSYRAKVDSSDVSSTCYALCKLLAEGTPMGNSTIGKGLDFLRSHVDLVELPESQFYVDHRIEISGTPQNNWPHFEDYSGLGGLCQLLVVAPGLEAALSVNGLTSAVLRRLLATRDCDRGWPRTYPTIYVTSFYLDVLGGTLESWSSDEGGLVGQKGGV